MKGQSLVELAVVIVLVLILLVGVVELGIAYFQKVQLLDAAQEGTQFGTYCQNPALIEQRVRTSSNSPIDLLNDPKVSIPSPIFATNEFGKSITVSVSYQHKVFMPFASKIFGQVITITGKSTGTILKEDTVCQ